MSFFSGFGGAGGSGGGASGEATGACSEGTLHGVPGDGAEYDSLTDEQQRTVTRIAMNAGKAIAA
jgi:hypothetical protein